MVAAVPSARASTLTYAPALADLLAAVHRFLAVVATTDMPAVLAAAGGAGLIVALARTIAEAARAAARPRTVRGWLLPLRRIIGRASRVVAKLAVFLLAHALATDIPTLLALAAVAVGAVVVAHVSAIQVPVFPRAGFPALTHHLEPNIDLDH